MNNLTDPLRNGDIFKLKAEALRSPPKIVQFDVPKGSMAKTPVKPSPLSTTNSEVRTAFDLIYRQTPTPKILLGRSVQERTSAINSTHWNSNTTNNFSTPPIAPVQTPVADSTDLHVAMLPEPSQLLIEHPVIVRTQRPHHSTDNATNGILSESEPESDHAEPEPVIKPVKRADISIRKSPNLLKKARIEEPLPSNAVVANNAPSRYASSSSSSNHPRVATTGKSRAGSRSRTGGADSLLLLLGGGSKSTAPSAAPSSSSASSSSGTRASSSSRSTFNTGIAAPRSALAERNISVDTASRGKGEMSSPAVPSEPRSAPQEMSLAANSKRDHAISSPSKPQAASYGAVNSESAAEHGANSSAPAVAKGNLGVAHTERAAQLTTESDSQLPQEIVTKHITHSAANKLISANHGSKRRRAPGGDSEPSDSEISPPAVKLKISTGAKRGPKIQTKFTKELSEDEMEVAEDEEPAEEVTVTRSGRKSIPKKTIPLAEDEMLSEKQQLKANRARRASSVTAPARRASVSTASRARKSLGSASDNNSTQAEKSGSITKSTKNSIWTASEVIALYSVHNRVDISAPDFWEQVSDGLTAVNFDRSPEECQKQWFKAVEEAAERKRLKEEKMRNATAPPKKSEEEEVPVKAKRLGRGALKKLAQESSKATRDDDIFDSDAMRSYWTEEPAIDGDLLQDLQLFDPTYHAVTAADEEDLRKGGGALGGLKIKQKGVSVEGTESEIEFGGSHVHKLHYRPPSKLFSNAKTTNSEPMTKVASNKLVNAKTGKVNSTFISKQVNAAVQSARSEAREVGSKSGNDSSDEDSSELDSDEEE